MLNDSLYQLGGVFLLSIMHVLLCAHFGESFYFSVTCYHTFVAIIKGEIYHSVSCVIIGLCPFWRVMLLRITCIIGVCPYRGSPLAQNHTLLHVCAHLGELSGDVK